MDHFETLINIHQDIYEFLLKRSWTQSIKVPIFLGYAWWNTDATEIELKNPYFRKEDLPEEIQLKIVNFFALFEKTKPFIDGFASYSVYQQFYTSVSHCFIKGAIQNSSNIFLWYIWESQINIEAIINWCTWKESEKLWSIRISWLFNPWEYRTFGEWELKPETFSNLSINAYENSYSQHDFLTQIHHSFSFQKPFVNSEVSAIDIAHSVDSLVSTLWIALGQSYIVEDVKISSKPWAYAPDTFIWWHLLHQKNTNKWIEMVIPTNEMLTLWTMNSSDASWIYDLLSLKRYDEISSFYNKLSINRSVAYYISMMMRSQRTIEGSQIKLFYNRDKDILDAINDMIISLEGLLLDPKNRKYRTERFTRALNFLWESWTKKDLPAWMQTNSPEEIFDEIYNLRSCISHGNNTWIIASLQKLNKQISKTDKEPDIFQIWISIACYCRFLVLVFLDRDDWKFLE